MYTNNYYANGSQQPTIPRSPQQPYFNNTPNGLKGRPVSSIEEARAIAIDFDGIINYFPDIANNRIYTKQFQMDGTATLKMYELKEIPSDTPIIAQNYVTREEFNTVINQLTSLLQPQPQVETTEQPQLNF